MTMAMGADMNVRGNEHCKVVEGLVGDLEPRVQPLRESRELALGNVWIDHWFESRGSIQERPHHGLEKQVGRRESPGAEGKETSEEVAE